MENSNAVMASGAPYGVVVMNPANHELLFANDFAVRLAKRVAKYPVAAVNLRSRDPFLCHQLFGGQTPCIHCPLLCNGSRMTDKEGRVYELTVSDIPWEGVPAKIITIRAIDDADPEPEAVDESCPEPAPDEPSGAAFYSPEQRIRQLEQELESTKALMRRTVDDLQATQDRFANLINSVPGGIGLCSMIDDFPVFIYMSDGVSALSGRTPEEYRLATQDDPMALVFEEDRPRVLKAMRDTLLTDHSLSIAYRVRHKNGSTVWIHLNGHRAPTARDVYVVFSGMSSESRLFQTIARDMAEAIYVIDRSNYDLLYISESARIAGSRSHIPGRKCYQALYGRSEPCEGCREAINPRRSGSWMPEFERDGRFYVADFCDTDWNGTPACVKYVRDVTDAVIARREKASLEKYFQNILENLPGGAAVIVRRPDGTYAPEFISEGFAVMLNMNVEETWAVLSSDVFGGVHSPDHLPLTRRLRMHIENRDARFVVSFRLRPRSADPIWVSARISAAYQDDGTIRLYIAFSDITSEVEERERMSSEYNRTLLEHYRSPAPDALIIGHGNLTRNRMIEVIDRTGGDLAACRGGTRDAFYDALCAMIVDPGERAAFRESFLSETLTEAYRRGEAFHQFTLFMRFPGDRAGRYARIRVQFTAMPDTGDLVGILTITDVTEKTISINMQRRLADASCETLMDVDLANNRYAYHRFRGENIPEPGMRDGFTDSLHRFAYQNVTPRDRAMFLQMTDAGYILDRLNRNLPVSFAYTMTAHTGEIRVNRLTVFGTDLRLGRVCISITDITQSVQAQQNLLNIMAYTFELVGMIDLDQRQLTVHSRESILNYQPPLFFDSLDTARDVYSDSFVNAQTLMGEQFSLDALLDGLREHPGGYEFVVSGNADGAPVYKQVTVLWGDENHRTICIVRADVTGMMQAESENRRRLEDALKIARAANDAKSEFLSSMSHDIRTPMNAIIGMTELALARPDDPRQVNESLNIIRSSSEHLLHLINNILDMSRIESGRMTLASEPFSHNAEMDAIVSRTRALALSRNIRFDHSITVAHNDCAGDALRIHQILDNLLGNAVKFTPAGGSVRLNVEEMEPMNAQVGMYRYIVEDTGIGIRSSDIPRLFEPFFRTEASRTGHIEGTGLGMSIVKNIVDFMGGAIRIESEENRGTRVTVELPLRFSRSSELPAPDPAAEADADFGGAHILLVEDHPVNRLVASRLLTSMNARVTLAENGRQGLELFTASAPDEFDVICMDLRMPVMDGCEAARAIRASAHPRAATIPIIAMTANAFAEDVQRAFDSGMTAYIPKPLGRQGLQPIAAALAGSACSEAAAAACATGPHGAVVAPPVLPCVSDHTEN